MNVKGIMWTSLLSTILIILGVTFLLLGSLPMENRLEGNDLVVKFVIGKKVIDVTDAIVKPVPEEATHNIIRIGGTSVGKKHSGNYMNTKTRTRFLFYLTGKGERTYFEIGTTRYLVDRVNMHKN